MVLFTSAESEVTVTNCENKLLPGQSDDEENNYKKLQILTNYAYT